MRRYDENAFHELQLARDDIAASSRRAFEQVMHAGGLTLPKNAIESNALVALRAVGDEMTPEHTVETRR